MTAAARAPRARHVALAGTAVTSIRGSLALSLGFYGWAVPLALDIDDYSTAIGIGLLTAGTGFFLPTLLSRNATATEGMAGLGLWGATRGIAHGMLGATLAGHRSEHALAGWGLAGSLAEGALGFTVARTLDMTQGTADVTGTGGDLRLLLGLGTGHLAGGFDERPSGDRRDWGIGIGLAGSALGLAAGYWLSRTEPYTAGDNAVWRAAAVLAGYAGLSVAVAVGPDRNEFTKGATAATMGAMGAGIVLGQRLVHRRDFTSTQGTVVSLGALGGGLLGLGVGFLASEDAEANTLLIPSAIGAVGGFALLYLGSAREARAAAEIGALDLRVDPVALAAGLMERTGSPPTSRPLPAVAVSYRF